MYKSLLYYENCSLVGSGRPCGRAALSRASSWRGGCYQATLHHIFYFQQILLILFFPVVAPCRPVRLFSFSRYHDCTKNSFKSNRRFLQANIRLLP